MPTLNLTTYRDAVLQLVDYLGGNPTAQNIRYCKQAVLNAYRELSTAHRWTYYYSHGRVNTVAPQNTGTVAYTNSTRQLTLTGAIWPSWAAYGTVVIANIDYQVSVRNSDTVLTLSVNSNPGADLASTTYQIYRDTYPLPIDFVSADRFQNVTNFFYPQFVHPSEWLDHQRLSKSPAVPRLYTYRGDPHYQGALAVSFYPAPDAVYQYDYIYQRRSRQLSVYEVNAGTVTASSGSAAVAGNSTAFDGTMVGTVLRFGDDDGNVPEGLAWSTPYERERVVIAVADASDLTVDTVMDETLSGVKYVLSDPIDLEPGAMLTAFQRCCEKQEAIVRIMKNRGDANAAYTQALILARETDSRYFGDRVAGELQNRRVRLAYMPRGPDVP